MNKLLAVLLSVIAFFALDASALRLKKITFPANNSNLHLFAQLQQTTSLAVLQTIWNQVKAQYDINGDSKITYKEFQAGSGLSPTQLADP